MQADIPSVNGCSNKYHSLTQIISPNRLNKAGEACTESDMEDVEIPFCW